MRTKKISLLLALVLVISAIALPLTAYAAGDKDTTPPELTASLDGDTLKIESSDEQFRRGGGLCGREPYQFPNQWGGFRHLKGLCRHRKTGKRVRPRIMPGTAQRP